MRSEFLVARLSRSLRAVRPRSVFRDALLLLVVGIVEVAAFLGLGFMRPDMPTAMEAPSFSWNLTSMGLVAGGGAGGAVVSIDPVRSLRQRLRWMPVCIIAIVASGWIIDAGPDGVGDLRSRLDWKRGLQRVEQTVALSIPPAVALGMLLRRCTLQLRLNRSVSGSQCLDRRCTPSRFLHAPAATPQQQMI